MNGAQMAKSPAFQFYPADFLSDENVAIMSLAARGAYITLLSFCWIEGSIPSDLGKLARLLGVDSSAMAELWEELWLCFSIATTDAQRLVNPRLDEERRKQELHQKERQESGRKGAKSRWKNEITSYSSAKAQPIAKPMAEPIANHGFSFPSSSSIEEKKTATSTGSLSRGTSPRSRASRIPDSEWLKELQAKPAYQALDVVQIFSKAEVWCEMKGKQLTRARFVNWLNREDRPIELAANGNGSAGHTDNGFASRFCPACRGAKQHPRIINGQMAGFETCGECNGTGKPSRQIAVG